MPSAKKTDWAYSPAHEATQAPTEAKHIHLPTGSKYTHIYTAKFEITH